MGFETIAAVATAAGSLVSAAGTLAAGNAQASAMKRRASREQKTARTQAAVIDRETQEARRETDETLGNLRAHAAASGLAVDSADIAWLSGDIARAGQYEVSKSQWQAGEAVRTGEMRARELTASAKAAGSSSRLAAFGTFAQGIGSAAGGYAQKFAPASMGGAPKSAPRPTGNPRRIHGYG